MFIFRPRAALDYDHRDIPRQKAQLRNAFSGISAQVDRWLDEVENTPTFYFDAITQLELTSWSQGRVTSVGDAGYCPGPAVGGSTSLAVYGAHVLAGEIAAANGDHTAAFASYERAMMPSVLGSRALARVNAKTIVPGSHWGVRALIGMARGVDSSTRCHPGARPPQSQRRPALRFDAAARLHKIPRNPCGSGGLCVATSWSATPAG